MSSLAWATKTCATWQRGCVNRRPPRERRSSVARLVGDYDVGELQTESACSTAAGMSQCRIRKTTPAAETLYFGDLYERVTNVAPASTAQTYYVHSPRAP